MRRLVILLLPLLMVIVTISAPTAAVVSDATNTNPVQSSLPSFNAISVKGFIHVVITGVGMSAKRSNASRLTAIDRRQVAATVVDHTLYLRLLPTAQHRRQPAVVTLQLYRLRRLAVYDRAQVTANKLQSNGLILRADTAGRIRLTGSHLVVNQIRNYGQGRIRISRLTGKTLSVKSMAGHITLIGRLNELRARLQGPAVLEAKRLIVNRVLTQTQDTATARVLPLQSLRAFATDHSHIYFYKKPQYLSRYTHSSGNVLYLPSLTAT